MATSTIAAIVDFLLMTDLPVASSRKARTYVAQPLGDERCADYFNRKSIGLAENRVVMPVTQRLLARRKKFPPKF
jgi:hypothetical protein